ncbi:MAG TPA: SGNH/GDSL hydrolase family protein, partial [Candidatus Saccharimonadales bacterium]|nr:SGNH/GDSL hydrolase family protein [Candidatus Saccharimonadales bacterium]
MLNIIKQKLTDKNSFKIVYLGDSITSSSWLHPNWRDIIEYVLEDKLMEEFKDWKIPSWGIRHINSGFDGSTSHDWLDKVQTQVINYNPDLVIVMGTSNDSLLKITPQQHSENI